MDPLNDATPGPPGQVPGYELLDKIGEGGMGEVYRARQLSLQRVVALKFLKTSPGGTSQTRTFQRESRLMASLAHPHIVAIHDCGSLEGAGGGYLVMEYVSGSTLRERMTPGRPYPRAEAAHLLDRIAEALCYIHEQGILHLDLKPENVLCDPKGTVKISDFGLAHQHVDLRMLSDQGLIYGTMDYCAPEQRYGLPVDARADLFSLATLAHELFTGHLPGRAYRPCRSINPRLPADLDDVLRRALARSPEDRQTSVEEFRQELASALTPPKKKSRIPVWGCTAVVCLAILALVRGDYQRPGVEARADSPVLLPGRTWLVYESASTLGWFDEDRESQDREMFAKRVCVGDRSPVDVLGPEIIRWPMPVPALVISSPEAWGFYHPLDNPGQGPHHLRDWTTLAGLPPMKQPVNLLESSGFDGNCLGKEKIWAFVRNDMSDQTLHMATLGTPPDQPGNPALLLTRTEADSQDTWLLFQWLKNTPKQPGKNMVLRFRARAAEGDARLAVGISLPLLIPKSDQGATASRLRAVCLPMTSDKATAEVEALEYKIADWIQPGTEWKTYCVLWQWPPYCKEDNRWLTIDTGGVGKIWLDDVEMFPWDRPDGP